MSRNKYTKKALVNTSRENQQILTYLAECYMSMVMEKSFDYNDPELVEYLDKLDKRWRDHARMVIARYPKLYDNPKKRTDLTSTFIVMARKLKDTNSKPIGEVMGLEFDWKTQNIDKIIEAFQTTIPKYSSKAKTIKGLEKVYEGLEPDQQVIFENCLKELVSSN